MPDETTIRETDGYPNRVCPGCGAARRENAAWWFVCGTYWHTPSGEQRVSKECLRRQLVAQDTEIAWLKDAIKEMVMGRVVIRPNEWDETPSYFTIGIRPDGPMGSMEYLPNESTVAGAALAGLAAANRAAKLNVEETEHGD
jgi:hypothetical protein